jgi:hypothetical protein
MPRIQGSSWMLRVSGAAVAAIAAIAVFAGGSMPPARAGNDRSLVAHSRTTSSVHDATKSLVAVGDPSLRNKLCRPGIVLPYAVLPAFPDEAGKPIPAGPYDHVRFAYSPALQFGYSPRFNPAQSGVATDMDMPRVGVSEISFAPTRRPIVRDNYLNLRVLEDDGSWSVVDLKQIVAQWAANNGMQWHGGEQSRYSVDRRVVVTNDCHIYTVVAGLMSAANLPAQYAHTAVMLLHSKDGGASWQAIELNVPGGYPAARIEFPANGAMLSRPPAIITYTADGGYGRDGTLHAHDLKLYVPRLQINGDVDVGEAKLLSTRSILGPYHASANQLVSFGNYLTVLYPTTELGTTNYPSLCTAASGQGCYGPVIYARTYDMSLQSLGPETRIGVAATASLQPSYIGSDGKAYSAADNHDQPTAAVDSKGIIHVVLGTHAGVLQYAKSVGAGRVDSGFTDPVPVAFVPASPLTRQYTYATMSIDSQDTLHLLARASYGFRLHYLRRKVGESDFTSPIPDRALIDVNGNGETGPVAYYHFNQKLTIDPWGRIWLVVTPYFGQMNTLQRDAYKEAYGVSAMTPYGCRTDVPTICFYNESIERTSEVYVSYDRGNSWALATTASFFR